MIRESGYPRVLLVAVWFGPPPAWLQLWLNSCRANPDLDWLFLTDHDVSAYSTPDNVHVSHMSMAQLASRLGRFAGVELAFTTPYKACDYRPLYSCLTELAPGEWDFWGHCDVDMIFGDIRTYLTPALLRDHDRVFGQGHFSVYRNSPEANEYFRKPHPSLDYREILADPAHRGFDEHRGVNRIWHLHGGRFHEDESVVADLDPHTSSLRLTATRVRVANHRPQAFGFEHGHVTRAYLRGRGLLRDEFMYLHFQKRHLEVPGSLPRDAEAFWITPQGFEPMDEGAHLDRGHLLALNPMPLVPRWRELVHRARHRARLVRRRLRGGSGD